MIMPKYSSFKKQQVLTENFRRFLDEDDREREGEDPGFDKIDGAEHARKHWATKEEEEEKEESDEDALARFVKDLKNFEEAGRLVQQAIQAKRDSRGSGLTDLQRESHLKRMHAAYKAARKLNPSGQPPEASDAAIRAFDAREEAGWADEEEEEDELDLMGMQFDASEEQMDWARDGVEEGQEGHKGRDRKKTSLLEIKRRRSKARRKQNK